MNTNRSRILATFTLASVLASIVQAQPAARTFTSSFFFGDSLSDNGNLFALTGQPPAPYFNGRFSNGLTFAEILVPGLQPTVTAAASVKTNLNFAFAGATAVGSTTVPASLSVQLGLFQGRAITPASTDLFVLLAGANDVLNGIAAPATQNDPAIQNIARNAAAAVTSAVQTLATAGARRFLVINLPNIAQTPRFTTGSGVPAASLAQSGSLAYNAAIRTNLAAATLPAGANVTLVDLQSFLNTIVKDPARFGFTDTTHDIIDILTAGGNPGDQSGYVFWDSIHPTTKSSAIIAGVLREILNPEFVLGTAGTQGTALVAAADMTADTVDARLNQARRGTNRHAADGFVSYTYKDGGYDLNSYQPRFDFKASVLTAGFDYQFQPDLVVGFAFSQETLRSKLSGAGSSKMQGQTGTVYAHWEKDAFFAEATATYGMQDFSDITRLTSLGALPTTARTTGNRYGGSLKIGHEFAGSSLHFTPFIGVRALHGSLDAYSETGVTGLNFAFGSQHVRSLDFQAGATADFDLRTGDTPITLGLSGVYSADLSNGDRTLSGRLADNLSQMTSVQVADGNGSNFKAGAHLVIGLGKRWSWTLSAGTETRNDGKNAVQYGGSIQTGF